MLKRDVLPPIVLQVVGLGAFIFFCGFWAVTGRVEPLLLAASGTLYGAGLAQQAKSILSSANGKTEPPEVGPAGPPPVPEQSTGGT